MGEFAADGEMRRIDTAPVYDELDGVLCPACRLPEQLRKPRQAHQTGLVEASGCMGHMEGPRAEMLVPEPLLVEWREQGRKVESADVHL